MISRADLRLLIMVNFSRLRESLELFFTTRWIATCPALEGHKDQASPRHIVIEVRVDLVFHLAVVNSRCRSGGGLGRAADSQAPSAACRQGFVRSSVAARGRGQRARAHRAGRKIKAFEPAEL